MVSTFTTEQTGPMMQGVDVAMKVASQLGVISDHPVVIQRTNNTVVWLRPHPVIAKVGTRLESAELLTKEFHLAVALIEHGAAVASPWPDSAPVLHEATGYTVTLWSRIAQSPGATAEPLEVGVSSASLHRNLDAVHVVVPSFRVGLERARTALFDDRRMAALQSVDLEYLRSTFTELMTALEGLDFPERSLHGEPHSGNYLVTPNGLVWIDFENACLGPTEWDLAFIPPGATAAFDQLDPVLLDFMRSLTSVQVATWCWAQARFPEMRTHGQWHLDALRARRHGPV